MENENKQSGKRAIGENRRIGYAERKGEKSEYGDKTGAAN